MTTANKITILRILLIPFFVVELLYYLETGNEVHRLLALLTFAVTAILDGVDGYIARRYNQKSELGAILDPLADKLLLVSAIITLSFNTSRISDKFRSGSRAPSSDAICWCSSALPSFDSLSAKLSCARASWVKSLRCCK